MAQPNKKPVIELPRTTSTIGPRSIYDGILHFKNSMSIKGLVKGEIIGGELLVVHPNARVEGNILVDYLLVVGSVHGKIQARRGVYFFENSIVRGSVLSAVIRMQSGVDFEGECNISEDEETDIFSISREMFYTTIFDKLVHELDEISMQSLQPK